jgi:hypothetical protein
MRKGDHLEDLSIDGRIILKWIFRKWDRGAWTDLSEDRHRWTATCECGYDLSGSIKCGEFLD